MTATPLTVHNAEILTAAVEIRTLSISGKQVTLAVFRQLQSASWLDRACDRRGPAWGKVNYCPDKLCSTSDYRGGLADVPHVHIIWQLGVELRRAVIRRPYLEFGDERDQKYAAAYRDALGLRQLFVAV